MQTIKIFIRLFEGAEVLVPVEAIKVENNFYQILNNEILDIEEDATSIWEFFPGDTVRCAKRDGDLVAAELVNSTFPNRKLYQVVFLIVKNLGGITLSQLKGFENEIKLLCSDDDIVQKQHPVVKKWLIDNCK